LLAVLSNGMLWFKIQFRLFFVFSKKQFIGMSWRVKADEIDNAMFQIFTPSEGKPMGVEGA
jgi:hypothetical protein